MLSHWLLKGLLRLLGGAGLAGGILWQVVQTTEQGECRAIVHAMHLGDVVLVDDIERRVEDLDETPFVFELAPGKHRAQLLRAGVTIDDQTFELGLHADIVLVLWDGNRRPITEPAVVPVSVVHGDRLGRELQQERAVAAVGGSHAVAADPWSRGASVSEPESQLDRKSGPAGGCRRRGCRN